MSFTAAQLKTEITTDPATLGYATPYAAGQDQAVADILNLVRVGISIKRGDIAAYDLVNAVAVSDYTALATNPTNAQLSNERRFLSWLECVCQVSGVRLLNDDGSDAPAIANFKQMFAAGTPTLARIQALATRTGSRAEQLWGANTIITASDIVAARNA